MSECRLKGMTWSHPRGYDPLVACSGLWEEKTGVTIAWDKRSLQDFESFPVEALARDYDLIVIDHPHIGKITEEGCLVPLDGGAADIALQAIADGSVGRSFASYRWQNRQWALPIDAAAQVQAFRPDLRAEPLTDWEDVLALARKGAVLLPLRPPHGLMVFYTLCGNLGQPCSTDGPDLVDHDSGCAALSKMAEIVALVDPACFEMDPIAVLDTMAAADAKIACAPLIYGYVNYCIDGFRDRLIRFADIPAGGTAGVAGSALGGTGIAVSAHSAHLKAASAFAFWIAGAEAQAGPYVRAGGQAGHAAAWEDAAVNAAVSGFYRNTRRTLEAAWMRPRHGGYMPFQDQAARRINVALRRKEPAQTVIGDLNGLFAESFR